MNEKINEAIKESGLKRIWIAEQLGITYNSLRRKLNSEISWKSEELTKLFEILDKFI